MPVMRFLLQLFPLLLLPALGLAQPAVNVGSKRFTESYILGEIVTQSVNLAGDARAAHQQGLGNTAILFSALKGGSIHVYPEYTGTIAFELLGLTRVPGLPELNQELGKHGLAAGVPLGFSNSYALAMLESRAEALGIARISDLARHPQLSFALSQEFLNRKDGWPALRQAYRLQPAAVRGLDHGLAYEVLLGQTPEVRAEQHLQEGPSFALRPVVFRRATPAQKIFRDEGERNRRQLGSRVQGDHLLGGDLPLQPLQCPPCLREFFREVLSMQQDRVVGRKKTAIVLQHA